MHFSTNKPVPASTGRQQRSDELPSEPGLSLPDARRATTPEKAFCVFFTSVMIAHKCAITNRKISAITEFTKISHLKEGKAIEMKAFIGLLFYRGLYGLTKHCTHILFSDRHGPAVFSTTMSRLQFEFFVAHICFDITRNS